jgi:hypothetical protein
MVRRSPFVKPQLAQHSAIVKKEPVGARKIRGLPSLP